LGLLDREPSHGYDLKREYDAYFGRGKPLPSARCTPPSPGWRGTERRLPENPSPDPARITTLKQQGNLVDALLADHGLFHLEADLRWIDLTAARLGTLAAEVVS
jgi:hypothetical protein